MTAAVKTKLMKRTKNITADLTRRLCSVFVLCFYSLQSLFPAASSSKTSSSSSSSWTVAAMEFTFRGSTSVSQSSSEAAKVLPQLILERISSGTIRQLPEKESLDRKLKELQTERISLFLQLSKENQSRDALVLTTENRRKFEKSIKEENEKIKEIEDKIKENLKTASDEVEKASENIEKENGRDGEKNGFFERAGEFFRPFALPFFRKNEENKIVEESVVLYKDDSSSLFTPSSQALEEGFSSWTFEKEVTAQKINGLLSGVITSYGDYCSVTVELRTYPGSKVMGTVTEVGMLSEVIPLAARIASSLSPKISNTLPVRLEFEVFPKKASENLVVTVDGVVQQLLSKADERRDKENSILVNAGIHRIVLESTGYESLSLLYNFSDENAFTLRADFVPDVKNNIHIRLKKYKDGLFYANALESSEVSEDNPYGSLTVNGKPSLALFKESVELTGEDEADGENNIAFIQIPAHSAFDGAYLVANAKPYDRAKNIDHRRRMMYLAYTGLICSLPWTFYNMGNLTAENNAYAAGGSRSSFSDVEEWQKKTYISLGVTAVFGALTVFELVRYLYAADKVLPVKARYDKKAHEILKEIEKRQVSIEPVIGNP